MQLPFRPKQKMKQQLQFDEPLYLTRAALEKMRRRLKRIEEIELPQAIADVRQTGEFGDFSENAEYQEAKGRMRRLHDQVTRLTEQLKIAIEIAPPSSDVVQMGSTVVLITDQGDQKRFLIVGPEEADPVRGQLSFKSPLGAKLMGRQAGEVVDLESAMGVIRYTIHTIS